MYSTKYRGNLLSDIVGHKKIMFEMKKRSKDLNFPEVMILEGESGSGKTTLAFIVSKLLNCKNPIDHNGYKEPCNKCESCRDINNENFSRDVSFYDASSMSKEDVSNLNDIVDTYPLSDKNKILIIDEAQELSKSGKGATLKLLEKKRQNVYFILCTMDTESLPIAVKRRGQTYKFKKVDSFDISEFLIKILKLEELQNKVPSEFLTEGVFTISENSNGSPGIALNYLERCLIGEIYDSKSIINELGLLDESRITDYLYKILTYDNSIFYDLSSIDIKEFYFKSYKILQECYIYYAFNFVSEEWKLKNYKKYSKIPLTQLFKLIQYFSKVESNPYFNERSFIMTILRFFKLNTPSIPIIEKRVKK